MLTTYLRQNVIALDDALQMMLEAASLMRGGEHEIPSAQVLRLAASSRCSAYDCEFVALARELNVPLVTMDKHILSEFPKIAVALEDFVSR